MELGKGRGRVAQPYVSASPLPQVDTLLLHELATGDEVSEELAFEPKPTSRKRTKRRS